MSRNSSGTYTRPIVTGVVAGDDILAAEYNSEIDDISTALTDSLSRSGKGVMQANLDAGGFKVVNLGAATANGQAVRYDEYTANNAAINAAVVHLAGAETITGVKTFSAQPVGIAANSITSTATGNIAATTVQGAIAELESEALHKATAETVTGVKTFQPGSEPVAANICKAWCVFNGTTAGTNAPIAGHGVTSVTRNGTGDYTINFTGGVLSSANYAVIAMGKSETASYGQSWNTNIKQSTTPTTSAVNIVNSYQDDNSNSVHYVDSSRMCIVIYGA